MRDRSAVIIGPILITVGLVLLLGQLGLPGFEANWPLLLLAVGIGFWLRWMQQRRDGSQIFTGTLLILLGAFFQWDQWFDLTLGRSWPFFPFAVGVAFLVRGFLDGKDRSGIGTGFILVAAATLAWLLSSDLFHDSARLAARVVSTLVRFAIPLGLILWGAWLLFSRRDGLGAKHRAPEKVEPPNSIRGKSDGDNVRATD
jgi:hypothetical protein